MVGKILLVSLSVLFMSACSHNQPNMNDMASNLVGQEKISELTKLSSIEETWIPMKIEEEIEWNSKDLLGRKYVWGATGPRNYDCSGFTQKIYGDVGIELPRVSKDQAEEGELVSFKNLQKGDLLFFATNRKKPGIVTHVGIYLGDNNFIHASSSAKKVVICNFEEDDFYKNKFLWARRVIQPTQHVASTSKTKESKSTI